MTQIETVRPGMTRADLEALFIRDGGISTAQHARYLFRDCHFIKVDVDFTAAGTVSAQPTDKILKISLPYLQRPFMD
jgi:hypothetical protein